MASSSNFDFLSDPNTTLIKLGEDLAQNLTARCGIEFDDQTSQADLLFKLNREIRLDAAIRDLFHTLRKEGNKATHQFRTQHKEAMDGLRIARGLAVWFHLSFGKQRASFKPGAFVPPQDPNSQLRELQTQIEQLKSHLTDANKQLESNQQLADLAAKEKEEYAVLAEQMDAKTRAYEQLALENEQALATQKAGFEALQKELSEQKEQAQQATQVVSNSTQKASTNFMLNDELTHILIEQRVKDALSRVNHLTQSILAKTFRGELTAEWREQNPDIISGENSAEALLERIKAERAAMKPAKRGRRKASA